MDFLIIGQLLSRGHTTDRASALLDQGVHLRHRQQANHQLLAVPDADRIHWRSTLDCHGTFKVFSPYS